MNKVAGDVLEFSGTHVSTLQVYNDIHCLKNRPRYLFIGLFIVNRLVTDNISAYRLIYRHTDILADFQTQIQYFVRF
jgi:hypothetical protein